MKRLISLLIALALILPALPPALASGTVPGTPPIPSVGDVWDGSAEQPVSLVERNGVYYYEITRCAQLAFIAQNGGDWLGYNYILGTDLIFNDVVLTWDEDGKLLTDPAALLPWTPIDGFKGDLLGNGHTVSGLYCSISGGYAGLFGSLYGSVSGQRYVGGITGRVENRSNSNWRSVSNCLNLGAVSGGQYVGGLNGSSAYCNTTFSYSAAPVTFTANGGALIGESDHIWGRSTVSDCLYLSDGLAATAFGGAPDTDGAAPRTQEQLRQRDTFAAWDFESIWAQDSATHSGYPYLSFQQPQAIALTGLALSSAALSLCAGDGAYLVASPLPAAAPVPILSWTSSRPEVAQVNKDGRVTAAAPGQAIITAATADGAYSAQCTVTVSARSQDEYVLGPITLEDQQGTALTAIPRGPFWATVPVTNRTSTGSAMLLLASYDAGGRYLGLLCSRVEGLNTGATVRLSLLLDNSGGSIASLKAFLIPSLANLTPIGPCVRFG